MTSPAVDLTNSFEAIFNDRTISDDACVFVKGGQARTEGARFTTHSRKIKTADGLFTALCHRFGNSVGDALSQQFAAYFSGDHRLRVGEMRQMFQEAERLKLTEVERALRDAYGNNIGDALAPLHEQVNQGQLVTDRKVMEVVKRHVGEEAYAVARASGRGVRKHDGLNELADRLNEVMSVVDRFNASAPRVRDAVLAFCRQGAMTRSAVREVVNDLMPMGGAFREELNELVMQLPASKVTVDDAFKFFVKANRCYKQAAIDAFLAQQADPVLCRMAGIGRLRERGTEFTADVRRDVENAMAKAQPAAQVWLDIVRSVREAAQRDGVTVSELFDEDAAQMVKEEVRKPLAGEAQKTAFKEALETRLKRETNFDFGVEYEIAHQQWSPEQAALFRETMAYVRDEMPHEDFFVKTGCVAQQLATLINEGAAGLRDPQAYLKACALTGLSQASWVQENLAQVSELFQRTNGRPALAELSAVLFGKKAEVPAKAKGLEAMWAAFDKHWRTLCEGFYENENGWVNVSAAPRRIGADSFSRIQAATSAGMKLERAVAQLKDPSRAIDSSDFYRMPGEGLPDKMTTEEAEASFVEDFGRQVMRDGKLGNASIHIERPDHTGTAVTNTTEGMTPEEAERFKGGRGRVAVHEKVFAALKELCDGHEVQYRRLVEHLTQTGAGYGMKSFAQLVNGGRNSGGEHTPLECHVTKNPDGSVVLECHTPEKLPTAKVSARYVFSPEGGVECTDWRLVPCNEAAAADRANEALGADLMKTRLPEKFKPAREAAYQAVKALFGETRTSLNSASVVREAKAVLMPVIDLGSHAITAPEVQQVFEAAFVTEMFDAEVNARCQKKVRDAEQEQALDPSLINPRMATTMIKNCDEILQRRSTAQTKDQMTALLSFAESKLDREIENLVTVSNEMVKVKQAAKKTLVERGGIPAEMAENFLNGIDKEEICPELAAPECRDKATGHLTPEALDRAVKGMAAKMQEKLAGRLEILNEVKKLGLPPGPALEVVQQWGLIKKGLENVNMVQLALDVASQMDVSKVVNVLKAPAPRAAAVVETMREMLGAAQQRLMAGLSPRQIAKFGQDDFMGLHGTIAAVVLRQHPELAALIDAHAGVFAVAGRQLTANIAQKNDAEELTRCFALYFVKSPEPASMSKQYEDMEASCKLVAALEADKVPEALAEELQARHNALRERAGGDRLPENPLASPAWQAAKAEIAARSDAGEAVDEAAVAAAYESAALRELENAAPREGAPEAAGV